MSGHHGVPLDGSACMSCWEDIDATLYVEYRTSQDDKWLPSGFCRLCVQHLLSTQWSTYVSALGKATCKAEQRRLLAKGPPINLSDKTALPCPDDGEVTALWLMESESELSPKLEGSLVGEERAKFLADQDAFFLLLPDESEEEKQH